jgi:hypothetical protein
MGMERENIPVAFKMIKEISRVQAALDNIQRISHRQRRIAELLSTGDRRGLRAFLESEFRADPKLMRMCLKELAALKEHEGR